MADVRAQRGPVWIEAAVNGPWSRQVQPLIPISVEEIVAEGLECAREGAAIIHIHAYDVETGLQNDDAETFTRIIEGIRDEEDVIVYPTIPFSGGPDALQPGSERARYHAIETLARRGLLEWAVVDPGSLNIARYEQITEGRDSLYLNPGAHIRHGLQLATHYGFHPSFAIYEPGFLRLGAALRDAYPQMPSPIFRFMFSQDFTFGFPPEPYALKAYLELLRGQGGQIEWMAAGLGVDVLALLPEAISQGGHVRVGLEDAPIGSRRRNADWVREARLRIEAAGHRLAQAPEIRRRLQLLKREKDGQP